MRPHVMLDCAHSVSNQVLGFDETPSARRSAMNAAPYSPFAPLTPIHSRSQSTPLPSDASLQIRSSKVPPIASTTQTKRARAPSDPFVDSHVPAPPLLSASYSSANTMGQLSISGSSTVDESSLPPTPRMEVTDPFRHLSNALDLSECEGYMRTWTAPDLPNSEFLSLLKLFPPFVVQTTLPRFPIEPIQAQRDIEEGNDTDADRKEIRVGTGTMWVGPSTRSPGWQGNWWARFRQWMRRFFC